MFVRKPEESVQFNSFYSRKRESDTTANEHLKEPTNMQGAGSIYGFLAVGGMLAVTPGPNMVYVMSRSIAQGRTAGLISLGGVMIGYLFYMFGAAFGITTLFMSVPYAGSGLAVVGNIGAPERMNYTVVGDTVNTAQRMEGLGKEVAPDAEIVILASETVVAAMTLDVKHEPIGAFTVKGRVEPVEVFRMFP